MLLTNFLEMRKSVREFTDEAVKREDLDKIKKMAEDFSKEDDEINYMLFENGKVVSSGLEGKAGYGNVMIKSPSYVGLSVLGTDEISRLKVGYYLEKINTEIVRLGLSTCWITIDRVDEMTLKAIFGEDGHNVSYLIAIGYPKAKKLFDPDKASPRKPVSEICFIDDFSHPATPEELEQYGLFNIISTIRFAPNYMNLQPWRFLIKGSEVELYMAEKYDMTKTLVDCGVIMYYFEELLKDMGRVSKWEISLEEAHNMKKIASFRI